MAENKINKSAGKTFMATGFLSMSGGKLMTVEQKARLLDAGPGLVRTATVPLVLPDGTTVELVVALKASKGGGVTGNFAIRIPTPCVTLGTAPGKDAKVEASQDAFDAMLASIK